MISKRYVFGFSLLVLVLLALSNLYIRKIRPISVPYQTQVVGPFVLSQERPLVRGGEKAEVRTWTFRASSETEEGTIRIGPFAAPAHLAILVGGSPVQQGNSISLEMVGLGLRLPLQINVPGDKLHIEEFDLPFGWRGRQVILVASAPGRENQIAISEPISVGSSEVFGFGLSNVLMAFAFVGLIFMFSYWASALWLTHLDFLPSWWVGLTAGSMVSLAGYIAYWAYFISPLVGKIYSVTFLALSVIGWIKAPRAKTEREEWSMVLWITCAIGCLYISVLYFFDPNRDFYDLAANRFIQNLPGDNRLPHDIGMLLYHGLSPKEPGAGWLSSDRPPLQCGLQLLVWPFARVFDFSETTASSACGVWLQLLWVSCVYGILRTCGVGKWRSGAWLVIISLNGFCFINTVYTWPKLCAGAFACGAVCLWFLTNGGREKLRFAIGGGMAALALLSHGGVAFSFIAWIPFFLLRLSWVSLINWVLAACAALILLAPWLGYQKYYEPPGNRLVKWHLAGQIQVDGRSSWQAMRDAYGRLSFEEMKVRKMENFRILFHGDWRSMFAVTWRGAEARRNDEFNHVARTLGIWLIMGFIALCVTLTNGKNRKKIVRFIQDSRFLVSWSFLTIVVWCLLLFEPSAVIFLGSYAVMLVGLSLLSVWLERSAKCWLFAVALLQILQFFITWISASAATSGMFYPLAIVVAGAASAVLLYFFWSSVRRDMAETFAEKQLVSAKI